MAASSNYSEAVPFPLTNSAEAYQYDELMGLLLSFSKARVGVPGATWRSGEAISKIDDLVLSLRELSTVLAGMEPQLQFVRKTADGHRYTINARAVVESYIGGLTVWLQQFTATPTAAVFMNLQTYIADEVASDMEKLQRRHTRVVLRKSGTARQLSSDPAPSPSTPPGSYASGSSGSTWASGEWRPGFGGGARRRRSIRTGVGKKLTRRQRRR